MHHFGEVPGAHPAGVHQTAVLGGQRLQHRPHRAYCLLRAANHDPVAVRLAPDTTGNPTVEVGDAVSGESFGAGGVQRPPAVATIDDDVIGTQQRDEGLDRLVDELVGQHEPDDAWPGAQAVAEFRDGGDVAHLGIDVVTDGLDVLAAQSGPHVVAHATQADHANGHGGFLSWMIA